MRAWRNARAAGERFADLGNRYRLHAEARQRFLRSSWSSGRLASSAAVRDPYLMRISQTRCLMRTSQTPLLGSAYAPPSVLSSAYALPSVLASHALRWCDFVRVAHFAQDDGQGSEPVTLFAGHNTSQAAEKSSAACSPSVISPQAGEN
jgi:hypothetical protein